MLTATLFTARGKLTSWCGTFFSSAEKPFLRLFNQGEYYLRSLVERLSFIKHLWAITGKCVQLPSVCSTDVEAVCLDAPQLSHVNLREEQPSLKNRWEKTGFVLMLHWTLLPLEPNGYLSLPYPESLWADNSAREWGWICWRNEVWIAYEPWVTTASCPIRLCFLLAGP